MSASARPPERSEQRRCAGRALAAALAVLAAAVSIPGLARATTPKKAGPPANALVLATHPAAGTPKPRHQTSCIPVRHVEVRGVVLVKAQELRRKLQPLAVACIGNGEVKALLAAVNGIYADRGYVTTQGYLPEQDLRASRRLVIDIVAGRIDKVIYREGRGDDALPLRQRIAKGWSQVVKAGGLWSTVSALSGLFDRLDDPLDDFQLLPRGIEPDPKLWMSFITGSGDVLEMDRIQQGIDQINRVASARAQAKLEPGAEPATSTVVVENDRRDSFRLNSGYETNGAALNGSGATVPKRFKLDLAKDNLVGINDAWRLSYAGGLDSNEARAAFSLPFRRFNLSVDGSYSESLAAIARWVEMFSRGGNLSGTLGYLIHRDSARQVRLDSTVSWRHNERFINGAGLTPEIVSFGRVGLSETRSFETMQLSYGAGLVHGLPIFGAIDDPPDMERSAPRAQFWKVDGNVSLVKALAGFGTARLDLNAQWSAHPLYSDEQLVLGSVATVRGFTNNAARADKGVVLRSEFSPAGPVDRILGSRKDEWLFLADSLAALQPYVFGDYGIGHDIANREDVQRAGIGAGMRFSHGRVTLDASIAEPVFRCGGERLKHWQMPEAYVTLSVKIL
jgi:hemolysin activation/secretion protein